MKKARTNRSFWIVITSFFLIPLAVFSQRAPNPLDRSQVGLRLDDAQRNKRRRTNSYFERSFEARASKKKTSRPRSVQPVTDLENKTRLEGVAATIQWKINRNEIQKNLLQSDVDLWARLKQLEAIAALPNPSTPWPPLTAQEKITALQELIGQTLMAQEAERSQSQIPTIKQITEIISEFKKRAETDQTWSLFLKRMELATTELENLATQKAWAQNYFQKHIETLNLASESKIRAVYESGNHPFIGQTFEETKEVLRVWLLRQNLKNIQQELIFSLKQKAQIKAFTPYKDVREK